MVVIRGAQQRHFGSSAISVQVVVAHARCQVQVFFSHLDKTSSHAAERLECVRIVRRVDQDSPWESAKQWPRVQKQTTVVRPELKGRWRNGAPNTPKTPNKLQSLEAALSSLGPENSGARAELEAALTRVRAQMKPKPRVSTSPDVAIVCRGHSPRPERQEGNVPWRLKSRMPRIHKRGRASPKLEADVVAEKTMLEEGRARLGRLEQQTQVPSPVYPPSRVAELEQQVNALVQERDAFRAAAIPTKKRGPVTPRPPQSSKKAFEVLMTRAAKRHAGRPVEEDVTPEVAQGLTDWLIDRQCDLRDAMEFGDLPSVGHLSRLISEGTRKLQELEKGPSHVTSMVSKMVPWRESVDSCFCERRQVWVERSASLRSQQPRTAPPVPSPSSTH